MDFNPCGEENDVDWNSEDEREIDNIVLYPCSSPTLPMQRTVNTEASYTGPLASKVADRFLCMGFSKEMIAKAIEEKGEENEDEILETLLSYSAECSAGSSNAKVVDHFIGMGFNEKMVVQAINDNGEDNPNLILETLLTYEAVEKSQAQRTISPQSQRTTDSDHLSSDSERSSSEDLSDTDSFSDGEEITNCDPDYHRSVLVRMGYTVDEASIAIERCGPSASIGELTDFICAAQISKAADAVVGDLVDEKPRLVFDGHKRKRRFSHHVMKGKKHKGLENEGEYMIRLPKPMIGFGVPGQQGFLVDRKIPAVAVGPPFFYYENVALAPKGVWDTISRFLYDIEPEFVDSKYFCAAARKRGYVHNLTIRNRYPLVPLQPRTIHQAFPLTKRWWPSWDTRTQLNCLQTCIASAKLTERIRKALEDHEGIPPPSVQKYVIEQCRKWNLVWVGRNKVAPLEPDELEMLLGFPRNHTRGGGISRTDRYKSLGNSFQVDTVAYHLSVLKDLYPQGINLLSLFSGIGGAEVALHRLGIPLKNVVSVEISEVNRGIMRCWWEQTNQKGNLIDIADVEHLDANRIEKLMDQFGGFDLVVGGSPCNNLTGSNRVTRTGLEGKDSALFFDFFRILDVVKDKMKARR